MIRVRKATIDALAAFAAGLVDENPARRPVDVYERTGLPSLDTAIRILLARTRRHQQWRRNAAKKGAAGRVRQQRTTETTFDGSDGVQSDLGALQGKASEEA